MALMIHPATKRDLDALFGHPPQSLLLSGPEGVGLATITAYYLSGQTALWLRPQDSKGEVDYEKGSITVEMIRRLYDQTRSKRESNLFVVIDNADTMSRSAQAAFLKLLEEPGESIHFILLSHDPEQLVATIHSRLQHRHVRPISEDASAELLTEFGVTQATKRTQLLFVAAGLPATLYRLAVDEEYFRAEAALTKDARDLLTAPAYDRLVIVQRYQSNRSLALRLVDRALSLSRRTMSAKPQSQLVTQLDQLLEARANIAANQSVRLQLAQFVLK